MVPGQALFEIVLTHEELIRDQAEFLAALQKATVLEEEVGRLRSITEGIIARKELLQREYELRQLKAELDTSRQVLQLHRWWNRSRSPRPRLRWTVPAARRPRCCRSRRSASSGGSRLRWASRCA